MGNAPLVTESLYSFGTIWVFGGLLVVIVGFLEEVDGFFIVFSWSSKNHITKITKRH